jgi:hypothetical protein
LEENFKGLKLLLFTYQVIPAQVKPAQVKPVQVKPVPILNKGSIHQLFYT